MAWHRGELADAEHRVREAAVHWHHCSDRMDASDGIELLGLIAAARERFTDAARLLSAADAARRPLSYQTPGFTASRGAAERASREVRQCLGEHQFAQAWDEGQALTLDDAVAYVARKGGGRKRPATGWASLTPAELEVVQLVSEGLRKKGSPGDSSSLQARLRSTCPTSSASSVSPLALNSLHEQHRRLITRGDRRCARTPPQWA